MKYSILLTLGSMIWVSAQVFAAADTGNQFNTRKETDPYIAQQVKNTIVKNAKNIQECWLAELKKKPETAQAKVEIDWQIAPSGKVLSPEVVRSEIENTAFNGCLLKKIQQIHFPPHEGKIAKYISHKFTFSKENK